jgi:cell wall-associated NlpC family hydrolase
VPQSQRCGGPFQALVLRSDDHLMALSTRICLLALCLLLLPVAGAAAGAQESVPSSALPSSALPTVANPARIGGAIPLRLLPRPKHKPPTLGQRAVRIAALEIGVPYRYGGSSPSGFDCSGLVAYVYARLGIRLPHNAAAQYGFGRSVDRGRLEPGDLVFFHGLGHVGLYIGHGRIIHAPQSGERVEIQSLSSRSGSVEGARRLTRD